jgi:hypothetical protein
MPRLRRTPEVSLGWKALLALLVTCLGFFYISTVEYRIDQLSQRLDGLEIEVRDLRQLGKGPAGEIVEPPSSPSAEQGPRNG